MAYNALRSKLNTVLQVVLGRQVAFATLLVTGGLSGCGIEPPGDNDKGCDGGVNLLRNPAFALAASGTVDEWVESQHAGERSFRRTSPQPGTLLIEKTGTQPWYAISQEHSARSVRGLDLVFSAELKLDLDDKQLAHEFKPGGGLKVTLWGGFGQGGGGERVIARSTLEHEPRLGTVDWTPVEVRLQVPIQATRMSVGFAHYANGILQVRSPALYACNPPASANPS